MEEKKVEKRKMRIEAYLQSSLEREEREREKNRRRALVRTTETQTARRERLKREGVWDGGRERQHKNSIK